MDHKTVEKTFLSESGLELKGRFIVPGQKKNTYPVVVMLSGDGEHGCNSSSFSKLPNKLAKLGIASFLFDFEGLGHSDGKRDSLSLTIGLSNVSRAMAVVEKSDLIDFNRIGLFGSSFGGNIAVLYTQHSKKIRCLGLKSPVSFYPDSFLHEFGEKRLKNWLENIIDNEIGFKTNFYYDALTYNTYKAASNITCPCLITHGSNDEIVPISQSIHLLNALTKSVEKKFVVFEGADHSYSNKEDWEEMATNFVSWFSRKLIT